MRHTAEARLRKLPSRLHLDPRLPIKAQVARHAIGLMFAYSSSFSIRSTIFFQLTCCSMVNPSRALIASLGTLCVFR
jgi:hypothetical protein